MKKNRILAGLLAFSLIFSQSVYTASAEGTEAPAAAVQAPETAAPAAPETQPQTAAPATQEQTQPATQEQTQPATQEQTQPADVLIIDPEVETNAPETQGETPEQPQTESETATEKETEAQTDTFSFSGKNFDAVLKFTDGKRYPESAVLTVVKVSDEEAEKARGYLEDAIEGRHRELSAFRDYTVVLKNGGDRIDIPADAVLTMTYKQPLDLQLQQNKNACAELFGIGGGAVWISNPEMTEELKVPSFQVSGEGLYEFAIAGITDLVSDGGKITASALKSSMQNVSAYAVVTNTLSGAVPENTEDIAAGQGLDGAAEGKTSENADAKAPETADKKPDAARIRADLDSLSKTSVALANANSSDSVTVVNLFADENGTVDTAPLKEVTQDGTGSIDVTDRMVLVNVVADSAGQSLRIPQMDAVSANAPAATGDPKADQEHIQQTAGRVIVNLAAVDDNHNYTPYTGQAELTGQPEGTYTAPAASLTVNGRLTGAVYAGSVSLSSADAVTMGAAFYQPESGTAEEPGSGEENKNPELPADVTVRVGAVSEGDQAKFLPGVQIILKDEEGKELGRAVTADGTLTDLVFHPEQISESGQETEAPMKPASVMDAQEESGGDAESDGQDAQNMPKSARLILSAAPLDGYAGPKAPTAEVIFDPETGTTDPEEVTFSYKPLETKMTLALQTAAEDGTAIPDTNARFAFRGPDGQPLTDESGSEIIVQGTGRESGEAVTLDGSLIPSLKEMEKGTSLELSVEEKLSPEKYTLAGEASQKFTVARDAEGNYSISPDTLTFLHRQSWEVRIYVAAVTGTGENQLKLAGARFAVKDQATGRLLTDAENRSLSFATAVDDTRTKTNLVMDGNADNAIAPDGILTLTDRTDQTLRGMKSGEVLTLAVSELQAPDKYAFSGSTEKTIQIIRQDDGFSVEYPADGTVTKDEERNAAAFVFDHKAYSAYANGAVTLIKRNYYNGKQIYADQGGTFYAALFRKVTDDAGNETGALQRVSDVKAIVLSKGKLSGSTRLSHLESGTYYVRETDAWGNIIGTEKDPAKAAQNFYADYSTTDEVKISESGKTSVSSVTIQNNYFAMPGDYSYIASFLVTKKVVNASGKAAASSETFLIDVFEGAKKLGTITFKMNGQSSITVRRALKISGGYKQITFAERNTDPSKYTVSYAYAPEGSSMTLSADQTSVPSVIITNTRTTSGGADDPVDGKAELKLTKKVTYKGKPMRVNAKYYIGMWTSSDTSGKPYYIRPLFFKNASEVTATLHIDLNNKMASGHQVTFWFAEVDSSGNKVTGGQKFGYEVGQNKSSITLASSNMSDEVVFTNSIVSGSRTEAALTDPDSGFAGDAGALAEAQELEKNRNAGTQTGDTTPVLPAALALIFSAAAIALLAVLKIRKKRSRR